MPPTKARIEFKLISTEADRVRFAKAQVSEIAAKLIFNNPRSEKSQMTE
jgi:hypothetical protein